MKPSIVCKEEKHLLGIARRMNQSENVKHNLIGKAQEEFRSMIGAIVNRIGPDVFYAVYDYNPEDIQKDDDEINYTYWFCIEVDSSGEIPAGMAVKIVPQGKYAVFVFDEAEGTLNGEKLDCDVYDFIDGVWLPNSGLELSDAPDFELILEKTGGSNTISPSAEGKRFTRKKRQDAPAPCRFYLSESRTFVSSF